MKKVLTIFCFSILFFASQRASAQAEIGKGDILLNAGLGLGYYYAGGVPVIFSAEWAINENISVGPYLGITSWRHRFGGYRWNYTFIDLGIRGSYHFSQYLNLNTDDLDLYGGLLLGYVASSYKDNSGINYDNNYGSTLRAGIFGGARYYFSEKFAANGELGYGIAPITLGITYKM